MDRVKAGFFSKRSSSLLLLPPGHARDISAPCKHRYAAELSHLDWPVWEHWPNPACPTRTVHSKSVHGWFNKRYSPECPAYYCFRKILACTHTQDHRLLGLIRTGVPSRVWVKHSQDLHSCADSQTLTTGAWQASSQQRFIPGLAEFVANSTGSPLRWPAPQSLCLHSKSWRFGWPQSCTRCPLSQLSSNPFRFQSLVFFFFLSRSLG